MAAETKAPPPKGSSTEPCTYRWVHSCTRLFFEHHLLNIDCLILELVPWPTEDALLTTAFRFRRSMELSLQSVDYEDLLRTTHNVYHNASK